VPANKGVGTGRASGRPGCSKSFIHKGLQRFRTQKVCQDWACKLRAMQENKYHANPQNNFRAKQEKPDRPKPFRFNTLRLEKNPKDSETFRLNLSLE